LFTVEDVKHKSVDLESFVKVEVGEMQLIVTESPVIGDLVMATGYSIEMSDSVVTRFGNISGDIPLTLACAKYSMSQLQAGRHSLVMCESAGLNGIKVVLDSGGLHAEISDRLSLLYDSLAVIMKRKFQNAFDRLGLAPTESSDSAPRKALIPMTVKIAGLDFELSDEIIPDCSGANFTLDEAIMTASGPASSLSFRSARLTLNSASSLSLERTTLTRKLQQIQCPVSSLPTSMFDEMWTVIEDEKFLNVAQAERAYEVHDGMQMASQRVVTVSTRGIKMSMDAADLLLLNRAFKAMRARSNASVSEPSHTAMCMKALCAVLEIELKLNATSSLKLILSDAFLFVAHHTSGFDAALDFRADVISFSRNHQLMLRRILNLSLDNSFKNIVVTAGKKEGLDVRPEVSVLISGLEVKMPLKMQIEKERQFFRELFKSSSQQDTSPTSSSNFTKYVSLYKCSMSPEFPKTWPRSFPSALFDGIKI